MRIAIMQPYFFPYIGQFQLIQSVDRFILMDDVQYMRHGWVNRNRILNYHEEGFQYVTVPVKKHPHAARIRDVEIADSADWKKKMLGQLSLYRRVGCFFKVVSELVEDCISQPHSNIAQLNAYAFRAVCNYIGMDKNIEIASELPFDYSTIVTRQDWAIQLTKQAGATEYYNPPGGIGMYSKNEFATNGIKLSFVMPRLLPYDQKRPTFTPGLSIVDVMMFNSPEQIRGMLNEYDIL